MSFPYWPGAIPGGGGSQNLTYNSTTQQLSLSGSTPSTIQLQNVYQVVAGNNVTLNPPTGQGIVQINAANPSVAAPDAVLSTLVVRDYIQTANAYVSTLQPAVGSANVNVSTGLAFAYGVSSVVESVANVSSVLGGKSMVSFVGADGENGVWGNVGVGRLYVAGNNTIGLENAPILYGDVGANLNVAAAALQTSTINTPFINVSTMNVSSINGAVPGVLPNVINASTFNAPVANLSSVNASSINAGFLGVSSINVSSINVSSINGVAPNSPNPSFSSISLPSTGSINMNNLLTFADTNTAAINVIEIKTNQNASDFIVGGTGLIDAVNINPPTPATGSRLTFAATDNYGALILANNVNNVSSLSIIADGVNMSSLNVSSINGAAPGGNIGANPAFSTITMANAGSYSNTMNPTQGLINWTSTLVFNHIGNQGNIYFAQGSRDTSDTSIIINSQNNGANLFLGASDIVDGTFIASQYDKPLQLLAPTFVSSLNVSSINGAAPSGGGGGGTSISTAFNYVICSTNGSVYIGNTGVLASSYDISIGNNNTIGIDLTNTFNDTITLYNQGIQISTGVLSLQASTTNVSSLTFPNGQTTAGSGINFDTIFSLNGTNSLNGNDFYFVANQPESSLGNFSTNNLQINAPAGVGAILSLEACNNSTSMIKAIDTTLALQPLEIVASAVNTSSINVSSINGAAYPPSSYPKISTLGLLPGSQTFFPNISTGAGVTITPTFDIVNSHYYSLIIDASFGGTIGASTIVTADTNLLTGKASLNASYGDNQFNISGTPSVGSSPNCVITIDTNNIDPIDFTISGTIKMIDYGLIGTSF